MEQETRLDEIRAETVREWASATLDEWFPGYYDGFRVVPMRGGPFRVEQWGERGQRLFSVTVLVEELT